MQSSSRKVWIGVIALGGIILLALGIVELRESLVVGKVLPERLGRQVAYTTVPLVVGLAIIVWCVGAGKGWARGGRPGTTGGEAHSAERR